MASMNPHTDPENYFKEVERCVRELGFVAVKLHTIGVPVMVHPGMGMPFASPALVIRKARQYPNVPIILAHAGYAIYTMDAYVTSTECSNFALETSRCTAHIIKFIIEKVGAERVMFG